MSNDTYNVGDLIYLSAFGRAVINPNQSRLGLVVSGPYEKNYICAKTGMYTKYHSYDIMLGKELLKEVPEDFIARMGDDEHEENPKGLEEISDGSDKERPKTKQN